ncbi:hypothetical protein FRC10_002427 [Ceratobasidium sp. 414]|nr:hypothetical protein FRC10_002427 [Ceratobasidium sp. 414]
MHLASSLGRTDVLKLLLDQYGADDTIIDDHGQSILDVAKDQPESSMSAGKRGGGRAAGVDSGKTKVLVGAGEKRLRRREAARSDPVSTTQREKERRTNASLPVLGSRGG